MNKKNVITSIAKKYYQTRHTDLIETYIQKEVDRANLQYGYDVEVNDVYHRECELDDKELI